MEITLQNISTSRINNIKLQANTPPKFNSTKDSVAFTGIVIRPYKTLDEVDSIARTFCDLMRETVTPGREPIWLDRLTAWLASYTGRRKAKHANCITEIATANDKIAGGYMLMLDPKGKNAYVDIMTLTPEVIKTRTGVEILKGFAKNICAHAEEKGMKTITWSTSDENKPINLLLRRFGAERGKRMMGSTYNYTISVEKFKNKLNEILR